MSRWQSEQSARQRKRGQKRVTGTWSSQKTFSLYADVVRRCTTYVELAQTTEANADASREHIEGAAFGASWPIPPSADGRNGTIFGILAAHALQWLFFKIL